MERKWEDLEFDCLVNVLGRVGMESLLLHVPFVCKSWYEASLNPSCWKHLVFPQDLHTNWDVEDVTLIDKFEAYYEIRTCSEDAFIKFVVGRSHGSCTDLSLPSDCSKEVLNYIADECPALISLSLPADRILSSEYSLLILPTVIGKWEHLENFKFSGLSVSSATIRGRTGIGNCHLSSKYKVPDSQGGTDGFEESKVLSLVMKGYWSSLRTSRHSCVKVQWWTITMMDIAVFNSVACTAADHEGRGGAYLQ
uniref:F-box domain-containing protein n=1 Tax=Salix viminalis TaxID=40686 RepID=A0A6N2LHR7_SALVM